MLQQTYRNFEALFIDDGSTDETVNKIKRCGDERFKVLQQKHKGVSAARNLGLEHIKGDYIAFMDIDDEVEPEYLKQFVEDIEIKEVDIVLCNYVEVYTDKKRKIVELPWKNEIINKYDIQKKLYGIENYIKNANLDRQNLLETEAKLVEEDKLSALAEEITAQTETQEDEVGEITGAAADIDELEIIQKPELTPDILLEDFKPQSPIVDSMRTALFDNPEIDKSIWNELSIWNRSFAKRIKTSSVAIVPERDEYKFRYILQKDKNAPLIILYPSIGEGYNTHHSTVFAKMFFDEGYSIVMLGSHFHWEFVRSMPEGYCPGIPSQDADNIKLVTHKILDKLENKYECKFDEKIIIGTSFGALSSLFVAEKESKNNTLGITKYIAISPPVELVYAVEQLDKNSDELDNNSPEVKHKTAVTAAKILQITKMKENNPDMNISALPFTEQEGKLITTFLLRQKLSDLIFTIENIAKGQKTDIYEAINNMSYRDYVEKYLLNGSSLENMRYETSLYSLADYLVNNDNYRIYHSPDDFFATEGQIKRLKTLAGKHLVCVSNGSHLGFLYRKEFQEALKADVLGKI